MRIHLIIADLDEKTEISHLKMRYRGRTRTDHSWPGIRAANVCFSRRKTDYRKCDHKHLNQVSMQPVCIL